MRTGSNPTSRPSRWYGPSEASKHELSAGEIMVQRTKPGWLLVEIGRGRYTKRFNLRDGEATELVMKLSEMLP